MFRLALLLALAAPAVAQVPDPTPPEAYLPLAIGNEWVYVADVHTAVREVVVGDSAVGGNTYAVVERTQIGHGVAPEDTTRFLVRVDPATAAVVFLRDGFEVTDGCPLDADFPADPEVGRPIVCGEGTVTLTGGLERPVRSGLSVEDSFLATTKGFGPTPHFSPSFDRFKGVYVEYASGIGRVAASWSYVYGDDEEWDGQGERLVYARVGSEEFGLIPDIDSTEPAVYYPLAVGFEREELRSESNATLRRTRRIIERDTLIAGLRYVVERTFTAGLGVWDWGEADVRLLRFDETTTEVIERTADGLERPVTCPLGAPFDVVAECPMRGWPTVVRGTTAPATLTVGGDTVSVLARKAFGWLDDGFADTGAPGPYAVGIGRLPQANFAFCTICFEQITFLRTVAEDGTVKEYGARYAVADEPAPPASTLGLDAAPNPTAGPLILRLEAPGASTVTLEAFDALGRRVWRVEAPPGARRIEADAGAWAPGLYVVRASTGGESAITTVVRR